MHPASRLTQRGAPPSKFVKLRFKTMHEFEYVYVIVVVTFSVNKKGRVRSQDVFTIGFLHFCLVSLVRVGKSYYQMNPP